MLSSLNISLALIESSLPSDRQGQISDVPGFSYRVLGPTLYRKFYLKALPYKWWFRCNKVGTLKPRAQPDGK